ncbi:ABC transporter permease [Pseudaminobacter sp. 19-2017]|uniref:ABC transporter permease n=1 Tax=Pseudaminobacter soli (ex Zhang et al. 2022) TaxID=2831468 RepID=A0A942E1I2_9HYPH|nr:ABC transporter permease [Pseudaminobacter soli]MBS3652119.1 ABC transporter permease [Pseudaminobacter soli]
MDWLAFLLSGTVLAATPLLIAALGELIAEKSGVLNLSVEGMMALGAAIGFIVVAESGSHWLAILAGGLASAGLAAIFAFVVLVTLGNQVATGIAVGILGVGLAGLIGKPYESMTVPPMARVPLPLLSDIPIIGPGLFNQPLLVYLAPLLAAALWWMFKHSKVGLVIRAVGESPESAHAVGYDVVGIRFLAVVTGGLFAGIAGAFISVASTTLWSDGMIAGRGWIVVALVVFAMWRVERVVIGAYLFGAATIAELLVQSAGIAAPSQLLTSIPYIATIIAIALLSMDGKRIRLNAPVSLGRVYNGAQ